MEKLELFFAEYKLEVFENAVKKLKKLAAKVGVTVPIWKKISEEMIEKKTDFGHKYYIKYIKIEVEYEVPVLNGWKVLARIDITETENLIYAHEEIPESYRDTINYCDHCNKTRMRNDIFVVKHENGEFKNIGRNCLADFVRSDAKYLFAFLENLSRLQECDADDDFDKMPRDYRYIPTATYLKYVAACIREYGWTSKANADYDKPATAMIAENAMFETRKELRIEVTKEDDKIADMALVWAQNLKKRNNLKDYLYNLSILSQREYIKHEETGFVASIIAAWQREKEWQAKREQQAASQHIGEIKKRMIVKDVTVTSIRSFSSESRFQSVVYLHKMHDANGNQLVWWGSRDDILEENETVTIKATIKDHSNYSGKAQTVVSRVTVV